MCPRNTLNTRNQMNSTELIDKEESYKIIGACFEVAREKDCGFLEAVYQECLEMEFRDANTANS